jgi:type VI secretion system protein
MFERSLLERIAHPDPPGARSVRPESGKVAESILRPLRDVLNIRRGSVPARMDCGMPDFNDVVNNFPVAIDILAAEVRQQIETFEPRLSEVEVRHQADTMDPLALRMHISGVLRLPNDNRRVRFDTVVGDDGRWRLET